MLTIGKSLYGKGKLMSSRFWKRVSDFARQPLFRDFCTHHSMGEEIKMNLKAFSLLLAVAFLANLGAAPSLYGQGSVSGGSVVGAVTDSSGAAVPNAEVTLTDVGTKVARTTKSNGAGLYAFREVPVGTYNLKVSTSGFRTLE